MALHRLGGGPTLPAVLGGRPRAGETGQQIEELKKEDFPMMARWLSGISTAALALVLASPQASAQLTGQVNSAEEGSMEGVVVSARRADSNITVSVITNAE